MHFYDFQRVGEKLKEMEFHLIHKRARLKVSAEFPINFSNSRRGMMEKS